MDQLDQPKNNVFEQWRQSYSGRVAWIILVLAIAYVFGSMAVDSGVLWQWGLTGLFVIDGLLNMARLIGKIYGRKGKADKT